MKTALSDIGVYFEKNLTDTYLPNISAEEGLSLVNSLDPLQSLLCKAFEWGNVRVAPGSPQYLLRKGYGRTSQDNAAIEVHYIILDADNLITSDREAILVVEADGKVRLHPRSDKVYMARKIWEQ